MEAILFLFIHFLLFTAEAILYVATYLFHILYSWLIAPPLDKASIHHFFKANLRDRKVLKVIPLRKWWQTRRVYYVQYRTKHGKRKVLYVSTTIFGTPTLEGHL